MELFILTNANVKQSLKYLQELKSSLNKVIFYL